jgi:hypothetical protein
MCGLSDQPIVPAAQDEVAKELERQNSCKNQKLEPPKHTLGVPAHSRPHKESTVHRRKVHLKEKQCFNSKGHHHQPS